jgi:hypothetical protein
VEAGGEVGDFPPIEFDDVLGVKTGATEEGGVAEGRDDARWGGRAGGEAAEGGEVAVVVMIVAEQHDVDGGQGVEIEAGGVGAARTEEAEGGGAGGEFPAEHLGPGAVDVVVGVVEAPAVAVIGAG